MPHHHELHADLPEGAEPCQGHRQGEAADAGAPGLTTSRLGYRLDRFFSRAAARLFLRVALGNWAKPDIRAGFLGGIRNDMLRAVVTALLVSDHGRRLLLTTAEHVWAWQRAGLPANFNGPPDLEGNLFTAWTGPDIGFMHTEKCGGISVVRFLAPRFHPLQINHDPHRDMPAHLLYRAPACAGTDDARYPLLWGHFDLPSLQRMDSKRFKFTLLREPRARLLSLYHYWHSTDPAAFDPDLSFVLTLAHRLKLEDFLNHDDPLVTDSIDNIFVRRLTGLYATGAARDPLQADPQGALAQAQAALEQLDFVGFTEHLDASLERLAARLGTTPPAAPARANITAENHLDPSGWFRATKRHELTEGAQAALHRRTALDQQLYAVALAKFEARLLPD